MQTWAIIANTIREVREKRLFWINLLISLIVAAAMFCIGFDDNGMSILFGKWRLDDANIGTQSGFYEEMISGFVSQLLVAWYIGLAGCLMGLISTADIFPSMMQRGRIDWYLARPLSRWKLFFSTYIGSLFFMLVQATFFIGLTFLTVGWRWHVWMPGYLWSIPLLVVLFSYLYCVCVACAVWTRSAMTSLFLTLACWFAIWVPQFTYEYIGSQGDRFKLESARRLIAVANWVVPNTKFIPRMAKTLMSDTRSLDVASSDLMSQPGMDSQMARDALAFETKLENTPWYYHLGSSLLFEIVVLLFAGWRFTKQDF